MDAKIHNSKLETAHMNMASLNSAMLASYVPAISQNGIASNFLDVSGCVIQTKDGLTFQMKENEIR